LIHVLTWWLIIQVIGLVALPTSMRILHRLPDRGYTFSKSLGLLLASYILWMGASIGVLNNDLGGILVSIILVAGVSAWFYTKWRRGDSDLGDLWDFLRKKKTMIISVEILFAVALVAWVILRAYAPYKIMETGGEKFMEIAFLNGILQSESFPPLDPWLSGFGISYYYFGYVMMALMTRLSGVASGIGFDLYDALLFALTVIGAFGVVYNLIAASLKLRVKTRMEKEESNGAIIYGLLGALLVVVMGNLEGLLEALYSKGILSNNFWAWLDIPGLLGSPVTGSWYPGYGSGWWWWRGSRVIQDIDLLGRPMNISPITEFPFFSFLLGDNHPHKLVLPFVLLAIALVLNLMLQQLNRTPRVTELGDNQIDEQKVNNEGETAKSPSWWNAIQVCMQGDWVQFLFYALVLGALFFLNAWDFPIYLGLTVLAFVLGKVVVNKRIDWKLVKQSIALGLSLGVASVLGYAFFYIGFGTQASGILPYVFPPTRLPQYLIMFGTFIFILVSFLVIYTFIQTRESGDKKLYKSVARWWLWLVLIIVLIFAVALAVTLLSDIGRQLAQGEIEDPAILQVLGGMSLNEAIPTSLLSRLQNPWLFLLLTVMLALVIANVIHAVRKGWVKTDQEDESDTSTTPVDIFVFLLIFTGLALTLSVEFFYIRDSFGVRMNTVFKFYSGGWVMLGVASAYAVWWMLNQTAGKLHTVLRYAVAVGVVLLIAAGMVYPVMGAHSRAQGFQGEPNIDGASGVAASNPDDWAAIQWLLENSKGTPIILEAPGKSYNYEGRISAFTGYPAVLGWAVHESQWRGNYNEQGIREPDIATIYTTHDTALALELLDKWGVSYVIVGNSELRYIDELCNEPNRNCNPQVALRKFDLMSDPVFTIGSVTIYAVP
jgi:YYY domain-containing protein